MRSEAASKVDFDLSPLWYNDYFCRLMATKTARNRMLNPLIYVKIMTKKIIVTTSGFRPDFEIVEQVALYSSYRIMAAMQDMRLQLGLDLYDASVITKVDAGNLRKYESNKLGITQHTFSRIVAAYREIMIHENIQLTGSAAFLMELMTGDVEEALESGKLEKKVRDDKEKKEFMQRKKEKKKKKQPPKNPVTSKTDSRSPQKHQADCLKNTK